MAKKGGHFFGSITKNKTKMNDGTPPKTNMDTHTHTNPHIVDRKCLFQTIIFRVHVTFRECSCKKHVLSFDDINTCHVSTFVSLR